MFHIPHGQPVPTASYMGEAAVLAAPVQAPGPAGMMQHMGLGAPQAVPQEGAPWVPNYDEDKAADPQMFGQRPDTGLGLTALALGGLSVLLLLVAFPISDAALLLSDFNFLFWAGSTVPTAVIIALVAVLVLYIMVIGAHGAAHGSKRQSKVELANIAMIFFMLLGVTLGLASMLMFHKEAPISMALKYGCSGNMATGEAQRYYANLLKLRETAACAAKYSITDCHGFASAAPVEYVNYFRSLEDNFRCSGFCHVESPSQALLEESVEEAGGSDGTDANAMCQTKVQVHLSKVKSHTKDAAASLAENVPTTKAADKKAPATAAAHAPAKPAAAAKTAKPDTVTKAANAVSHATAAVKKVVHAATGGAAAPVAAPQPAISHRPQALFSTMHYKQSCDGAAARALSFSAIGTSNVWCWMAMALIGTSASLGFGQWLSA